MKWLVYVLVSIGLVSVYVDTSEGMQTYSLTVPLLNLTGMQGYPKDCLFYWGFDPYVWSCSYDRQNPTLLAGFTDPLQPSAEVYGIEITFPGSYDCGNMPTSDSLIFLNGQKIGDYMSENTRDCDAAWLCNNQTAMVGYYRSTSDEPFPSYLYHKNGWNEISWSGYMNSSICIGGYYVTLYYEDRVWSSPFWSPPYSSPYYSSPYYSSPWSGYGKECCVTADYNGNPEITCSSEQYTCSELTPCGWTYLTSFYVNDCESCWGQMAKKVLGGLADAGKISHDALKIGNDEKDGAPASAPTQRKD